MSYLRLLRQTDLRTIQNSYVELFQLQPPSRRALEEALASSRWLCIAAVSPDSASPSRQEYMGGFVMSVVASVADFHTDMNYYKEDASMEPPGAPGGSVGSGGWGGGASSSTAGGSGSGGGVVGVQATGLEVLGLPVEERAVNICLLGVLPSYRRRGLARLMLRQVVDSARTASACAVFLHVRPNNTSALALYQSAGFVPAALVPDYYDGGIGSNNGSSGSSGNGSGSGQALPASAAAAGSGPGGDDEGPKTAGGDAILLVLPLTEAAAAAVAAAAAAAAPAVAAAAARAVAWEAAGAAADGQGTVGSGTSGDGVATREDAATAQGRRFTGRGAASSQTGETRAAADRIPAGTPSSPSIGRVGDDDRAATGAAASTSSSRGASYRPADASRNGGGDGGGGGGLFRTLAAAAAGAVDGLSVLLPGRFRGGPNGGGDRPGGRPVKVGDEVLLETSGPDGEVYLKTAEEGAELPAGGPSDGAGRGIPQPPPAQGATAGEREAVRAAGGSSVRQAAADAVGGGTGAESSAQAAAAVAVGTEAPGPEAPGPGSRVAAAAAVAAGESSVATHCLPVQQPHQHHHQHLQLRGTCGGFGAASCCAGSSAARCPSRLPAPGRTGPAGNAQARGRGLAHHPALAAGAPSRVGRGSLRVGACGVTRAAPAAGAGRGVGPAVRGVTISGLAGGGPRSAGWSQRAARVRAVMPAITPRRLSLWRGASALQSQGLLR